MTQHSSDMVERVSMAISFTARIHGGIANPDEVAIAALGASHHAELVEALYLALDCLQVGDPEREHPRTAEAITKAKAVLKSLPRRVGWEVQYAKRPDGSLREIGGDA